MKIAYILDTYPSLTETFIAREIEALRRRGLAIEVYALNPGTAARPIAPLGFDQKVWSWVQAARHDGGRVSYFQKVGQRWWREGSARGEFTGVRHIHAGWASHPAAIAWGAARASGLPWSFSGHARDLFVEGAGLPGKLGAARYATVCTRAGESELRRVAPHGAAKVMYSPHGLEIASYRYQSRLVSEELKILAVGRLVEKKGFSVLLAALAGLKRQGQRFSAHIVGDGPLWGSLNAAASDLGLQADITFRGALPHQEVREAMQETTCLVVPSVVAADGDRDGLPNVILEAAAVGLPIVATDAGSIADFVDSSTGRLCSPNDPAALARQLHAVVTDQAATMAKARAARRRLAQDFDVDRNVERLARAFAAGAPVP